MHEHALSTLLFGSSLLQPAVAPLVLGIVAVAAFYGFRRGVFRATLLGLIAFGATLAALGAWSPVAAALEMAEVPRMIAIPGSFVGVLVAVAGVLALAAAAVPAESLQLAPRIDRLGGAVVGLVAGIVAAGGLLVAASFLPLPQPYRINFGRLALDPGRPVFGVFARSLGLDAAATAVALSGEPGTPPEGGKAVTRPAWSEPFVDANGSLARDDGEPFLDTDSNDAFTPELAAADTNGNGRRDIGLLEHYRLGQWLPLTTLQAPVLTSADTAYVTDGAPEDTVVYQATATDADPGDVLVYSVKAEQEDDAALVIVDPATGAVTLKSPPDREQRKVYAFTVVVTDKAGLAAERPITLHVTKKLKADREPSPGATPASL
jgi:uncharacterized membrane protein required for colicin V production